MAVLSSDAVATLKSYAQVDLQSKASDQICVDLTNKSASAEFTFSKAAEGMLLRFSVPDGESAVIGIYDENTKIIRLTLTSKWMLEYFMEQWRPK